MNFKRFNRVELLVAGEHVAPAAAAYSELLGVEFPPVEHLTEPDVNTTTAWEAGIEFVGPVSEKSALYAPYRQQGPGGVGPIVWEVDDIDTVREVAREMGIRIAFEYHPAEGGLQITLNAEDCMGYMVTFTNKPGGPHEPVPGSGALISGFNRVELLLPADKLDPARDFFSRLLDVEIKPLRYYPEHHVRCVLQLDAKIELYGPGDAESGLHQTLAERNNRPGLIGPVVWNVSDIDKMRAHAEKLGHKVTYELTDEEAGHRQICLSPETLFGYTATFNQFI